MSIGTFYVNGSCRGTLAKALIKFYDLDIKISDRDDTYSKNFPLNKVPTFLGPKGFKLTEVIAIDLYLISLIPQDQLKYKLLGGSKEDYAQVIRWLSLTNSELLPTIAGVFLPLAGRSPYHKKHHDDAIKNSDFLILNTYEKRLSEFTYLVGERITLADLFAVTLIERGFDWFFDKAWRSKFPNTTRWFLTVTNHPILKSFYQDYKLRDEAAKPILPKKEKKPKQAQEKSKPVKQAKSETPKKEVTHTPASNDTKTKKPKHPLEALGKSKIPLDEWKRVYSNEDTRSGALPWFWENYDPSEWSLWKVDYKYNDELTLTFMSNNLVGGFFNRLSGSTKYLFGCLIVYGENNNNGITGAFLVRGQDYVPAFDVAPDWESYSFTKLDGSKSEDKSLIEDLWAWDKPLIINGESREIADGKVFK